MRLIRSSLMTALGLPVTLALPLQPMATWASAVEPGAANQPAPATVLSPAQPQAGAATQGSPQPLPYRELRPQLLAALRDCTSPQPLALCEPASQRLQELIAISERPTARELRPRCLGALTLLDTHLTVFRWGFEPRQQLDPVIQQVEQACPAPISAAPAASN